jgi:glycosyltransferase involved in cell wall biosynthesis
MQHPDLTVVVPTRNEARNIPLFLASLPADLPLVVVDASDDDTPEIVRRLRPESTLVIEKRCTIPEARQVGAEAARSEWLLFTDADIVFPADYFARLASHFTEDCVYGSKLSRDRFVRYYRWFSFGQQISHRLGIPAATGSNLAVRRKVLMAVGGFDPELVCNEDSDLAWRIKRAGHRVHFSADTPVYATDHRRLERGLFRKSVHSLTRCLMLYSDLAPSRWRRGDWGYWSDPKPQQEEGGSGGS